MQTDYFKCPQCGARSLAKKIINNNYACINPNCELNIRLVVHGEITTSGKVDKLYGWVLEPGAVLKKKYKIVKMLGKGGFGATYLAYDQMMFNQLRAIKETPRAYCDEKEDEFLTFLNHPAIPKLYERFNLGKFHYSVMEFVEGTSLEEEVKQRRGALPEAKILEYAIRICDVLNYIHSQRVVHRDLKPENILVRKDRSIALIDFGISKEYIMGQGTRHLARAASHSYSSPEQYQAGKGNTDFKSDIYSFGAIIYFISTGIDPLDALSRDAHNDISPLPRNLNAHISPNLENVIIKAMKMQKKDRFTSVSEMKHALLGNGKTKAKKICPKCKVLIETSNKFCPNCGTSTKPIKKKAPSIKIKVIKGNKANQKLIITNSVSNGKFKNKITPQANWMEIKSIKTSRKNQQVELIISTKKLNIGQHKGKISIGSSRYIDVILTVAPPRFNKKQSLIKPIFLFELIALLICYLGPTASVSISKPWVIGSMSIIGAIFSSSHSKIGSILGLIMGVSFGAAMNMLASFIFPFINTNITVPLVKLLSSTHSASMNYAAWGLLGLLSGVMYVMIRRRIAINKQ